MIKFTIILFFVASISFSQKNETNFIFRKFTGHLVDEKGIVIPGQNITIKGTNIGTQTDIEGNFCLVIPKNETVFIEILFCFNSYLYEIKPESKDLKTKMKKRSKTKKAYEKWNSKKEELIQKLSLIYNSSNYNEQATIICQ